MAVHLTPTELADELNMKRREVLAKCIEMDVPILNGRIDKTLFESSLRALQGKRQASDRLDARVRVSATRLVSLAARPAA